MQVAAQLAQNNQTALIGGVEYDWAQRKNANSLFLMTPAGTVTGSYQKRQFVPFGEFVPGRRWMPFLEALHVTTFDMKAGAGTQPLLDGGPEIGKIGATICFESSYPRFLREQVSAGRGPAGRSPPTTPGSGAPPPRVSTQRLRRFGRRKPTAIWCEARRPAYPR